MLKISLRCCILNTYFLSAVSQKILLKCFTINDKLLTLCKKRQQKNKREKKNCLVILDAKLRAGKMEVLAGVTGQLWSNVAIVIFSKCSCSFPCWI